jgi:serine/threonine protein kinase/WD40 repeat protein
MTDETIFAAALEKTDLAKRSAYLDGACPDDPEQRKRIESLLEAHDKASGFLERPAVSPPDPDHAPTKSLRDPRAEPADAVTRTHGPEADDDRDDALGFLDPTRRPDSLGRLGHYEVLEVLGKGGFGIVFRAFDELLQRVVAVKVLAPSLAATSPARKRFLREARSAAPIQHENVVRIHETGEQPLPYLVMEFIPGETLQQRLDRAGPLEVADVLRFSRQIAEGLAAAHAKSLIHRDIKPSNILIDSGPQQLVKITDFGLARAADDASLTRSGIVAGTPMYMAPEQAKGESLDHRADLFSLGSVMYAMLTGRPPFRATTTLAVLKRVAEDDPRPIREVIPEVPEWLCRIVEKLHAKEPADRFASAGEVADVLADCERQLQTHKELRDTSRIPNAPPPATLAVRLGWPAIAAAALLIPVIFAFLEQARPGDLSGLLSLPAAVVMGGLCAVLVVGLGQKLGWIGPEAGGRPRSAVRRWTWAIAVLILALIPASVWFGRAAMLYADNAGELELVAQDGLVSIIVLQNEEGVYNPDKLRTMTTDWLDMKDGQKLRLPSGTYQLNAGTFPAGSSITHWEVTTSDPFGSSTLQVPGEGHIGSSVIVTVERGKRLTVRPAVRQGEPNSPQLIRSGRLLAQWGQVVDPVGDCLFFEEGDRLSIVVPGNRIHDLNPQAGLNFDAPRVLRDVTGDFEAQLTVLPFPRPPSVPSLTPLRQPYIGAGLTIWQDRDRFVRFVRASMPTSRDGAPYVHSEQFEGGKRVSHKAVSISDGPVRLRVRRLGNNLELALKSDVGTWTELATLTEPVLPQTVQLGVLATSSLSEAFTARFERFSVQPLASEPAAGEWVQLFNGKDLAGWQDSVGKYWTVENGILVSRIPADAEPDNGRLLSLRGEYADFHVRAEVKLTAGGDSGLFVRSRLSDNRGYQVQIYNGPGKALTGSILVTPDSRWIETTRGAPITDDTWLTLEVIARGEHLIVKVDGKVVADVIDSTSSRGHVQLEAGRPGTVVQFRKIEIKELPPEAAAAGLPPASPGAVDLIPLARPEPKFGNWKRDGDTLVSFPPPPRRVGTKERVYLSAFSIPVTVPQEFVLEAVFERLAGNDSIAFNVPAGGTDFMIQLDGYSKLGYISGLQEIDGKSMRDNETCQTGPQLVTGRKHLLRATVRATGVAATLDGRSLFDYRGGLQRLSSVSRWARDEKFYIVIITSAYRIHALRLTPLDTAPPAEIEVLKQVHALDGHKSPAWSVAVSPDGTRALSGDTSGKIILWDIAAGQKLGELTGHTDAVESLAFSPDGKSALSGSKDLTVRTWNPETFKGSVLLSKLPQVPPGIATLRDGKRAIIGGLTLSLIDLEGQQVVRSFQPGSTGFNAIAVGLSRDEKFALSGGMDERVSLWDVETGQIVRKLDAVNKDQIRAVAFFPDGRRALSVSHDGLAHIWDVKTGKPLSKFGWHTAGIADAVIHPNGRHVISAGRDRMLRVWDSITGTELQRVELPSRVKALALSPDGRTLVSTCGDLSASSDTSDLTVRVWRVTMPVSTAPQPAVAPAPRPKF